MDTTNERTDISLRPVTVRNWMSALRLTVAPEQQRFVAEYAPVAAVALAKAYVRPGGAEWAPYAIYAQDDMVGFVELAYEPATSDQYWVFHFFIDARFQRRGYGRAALQQLIAFVQREHPACEVLQLVVHPDNTAAQALYISAGFLPTGDTRWGEPVYQLRVRPPHWN